MNRIKRRRTNVDERKIQSIFFFCHSIFELNHFNVLSYAAYDYI